QQEALVLCVDVGHGMVDSPNEETTSLGLSIQIISMLVQRKIFSQSKDEIALVLFGTDETANPLHQVDNDSYHNIAIAFPMGTPNFDMLNFISNQLKPGENEADFVDALTVSLDHLYKETRSKKITTCRIVMFTNFSHASSDDNLDGIIGGFNVDGMHVQL
uniref:Ku70/Ku80 N-terminal alpha/beta domain-containing protein n=1 Tax=Ciona savignyi TaxID=51511 RepID=H2Y4N5_CIOSA